MKEAQELSEPTDQYFAQPLEVSALIKVLYNINIFKMPPPSLVPTVTITRTLLIMWL